MSCSAASMPLKMDEAALSGSYNFEALSFSSIDPNLVVPLSLVGSPRPQKRTWGYSWDSAQQTHPTRAESKSKPLHEIKQSRQDSRASHRSSLHRSSSLVFRTLPPIRRMPSLQVPSLTDISNPHNIPNPRSLNQIPEASEATSFKLKLPLTLIHPNSPYVPWDPPVRQRILCAVPVSISDDETEEESSETEDRFQEEGPRDKKPLSNMWNALKSAPKKVKTKCRRLLNPRVRGQALSNTCTEAQEDQVVSYVPQLHTGLPLSPAASFLSSETHSLAVWLSERQRKFLDKDCESSKLMTIDEYDRVGSWIKPGDYPFTASRTSYQRSFVSDHNDTVSGIFRVFESEGDLALSAASPIEPYWTPSSPPSLRASPSTSRTAFGPKREEERLSRLVHRASLLSYMAERPLSPPSNP